MWILSWSTYKFSKFATFVSIVGALLRYACVLCLFSGLALGTVICFGLGVGIHFLAELIGFSGWKKNLEKQGIAEEIKNGNKEIAEKIIANNSGKKYVNYIRSLNPEL
jgi:hypothetical protein